jgi:uncharacterized membrane protein YoaK (UPF0700 family)
LPRFDALHVRDGLLIALTLSMGSLDAISWVGLDKVYSAFQTGNLVVLGLGAAGAPGPPVLRAGVSLAVFGIGALVSSRLVRDERAGELWPRRVTVIEAAAAVILIGFLAYWLAVAGDPSPTSAVALIAIGASAAGLQTGAIFELGVRAVFTTAATATWTALMADIAQGRRAPPDLARLAMVVVGVFAGALLGGMLMVHERDYAPVLPAALTLLVTVIAAAYPPRLRVETPSAGRDARTSSAGVAAR